MYEIRSDGGNKDMRDIYVCFATDDGYAPYCAVAVKSIIMNAALEDRLFIYILHAGLSEDKVKILKEVGTSSSSCIELIELDVADFKDMPLLAGAHFSYVEAYFRFAIPSVLDKAQKVLYLDCDVIIRNSLWPLYNSRIGGKPIGMIRNHNSVRDQSGKKYYNSGVILIDCKKWRDQSIEYKLYQYAKENRNTLQCPDQDVINGALHNSIFELEDKYNKQIRLGELSDEAINEIVRNQDAVIYHYFTEIKPWHGVYQNKLVDEYFSYMRQVLTENKDLRSQKHDIDKKRYYEYLTFLRYFIGMGIIQRGMQLLLVFEEEIKRELEFAAKELGFAYVGSVLEVDIKKKFTGHPFMLIDSRDYKRFSGRMRSLGYSYCRDYGMMCLLEDEQIQRALKGCLDKLKQGVVVYGTGDWADRFTEALNRIDAEILFYMDSDKTKDGSQFSEREVIHPQRLSFADVDYDKIIIASSAFVEIKELLLNIGVDEKKIVIFDFMGKQE